MATQDKQEKPTGTSKPATQPRVIDPVKRLEKQLAEAKAKAAERAQSKLAAAKDEQTKAQAQVERAQARLAKANAAVESLEQDISGTPAES